MEKLGALTEMPDNTGHIQVLPGAISTLKSATAQNLHGVTFYATDTPDHTVTTVPAVTVSPVPIPCPDGVWTCLTPPEAHIQLGDSVARSSAKPCGYELDEHGNVTWSKYCFISTAGTADGVLPPAILDSPGLKNGDDIYFENASGITHAVVNKSLAGAAAPASGPVQAILDFIANIFGASSKPPSKLDIVGFNPQPEPPNPGDIVGRLK
jgi:hypothetical protein